MFNKEELRTIVKFLWLKGLSNTSIAEEMINTIGDEALSLRTIGTWVKRFESGDFSVVDKIRSGRPEDNKLKSLVEIEITNDRHLSAREIARRLSCSPTTVTNILRIDLEMRKVNSKWIPHSLNSMQRESRVKLSQEILEILNTLEDTDIVVTLDETWIPWDNNYKFMWLFGGEKPPECVKKSVRSKKSMVAVSMV